jgi:hypothetical protein
MIRLVAVAALTISLAACAGPVPGAAPTRDPSSRPTASPAASPTGSPTPESTGAAAVVADLRIPTCGELFTESQVAALMGPELVPLPGDYAASVMPELQAWINAADSANCWWGIPATERSVIVSIVRADPALQADVAGFMAANSSDPIPEGSFTIYSSQGLDTLEYTESHELLPDVWVAVFDGGGLGAAAITIAAVQRVVELNPSRY